MEPEEKNPENSPNPPPELPKDLLISILKLLPLTDVLNAKTVSAFWKSLAEFVLSSSPHSRFLKSLFLILPQQSQEEEEESRTPGRIWNLEESFKFRLSDITSDMFLNFPCIGSSQEWLIFLDKTTLSPFLYNPFTEERKPHLPSLKHYMETLDFSDQNNYSMVKAILTLEPEGDHSYTVVLNIEETFLYFKNEGESSWIKFYSPTESARKKFENMICCGNRLYAIGKNTFILEWDVENFRLRNSYVITPNFDPKYKSYLVELDGNVLLVLRYIIESQYRFKVMRMDFDTREGVWMKSLGDNSLFLGGNHGVAVPTKDFETIGSDCIYFTDQYDFDSFSTLPLEADYGCSDMGVYSLKDEKILGSYKLYSTPCPKLHKVPRWLVRRTCSSGKF